MGELMTTEAVLVDAALKSGDEESPIWSIVQYITVFARMSPQGKARIIRSMQQLHGHQVLMCGDGGNDVGALKQAGQLSAITGS